MEFVDLILIAAVAATHGFPYDAEEGQLHRVRHHLIDYS